MVFSLRNMNHPEHSVTSRLRLGADDGELFARERVEQRGFSSIRTAQNADKAGVKWHGSDQLHLAGLVERDANALDAAVTRLQHFHAKPVFLNDFAFLWDSSGEFTHETGYSGRSFALWTHAEQLFQAINIHIPRHEIGILILAHHLRDLMLIADFADDLLDEIFDGHQARDSAILVDHNRHANFVFLHLAKQIARQLGLRDKIDFLAHQGADRAGMGLSVEDLQNIFRVDQAHDVVDAALEDRYS